MKLRVWVEVRTVHSFQEEIHEVPDAEWEAMTAEERDAYKMEIFDAMRDEIANGGCEEDES